MENPCRSVRKPSGAGLMCSGPEGGAVCSVRLQVRERELMVIVGGKTPVSHLQCFHCFPLPPINIIYFWFETIADAEQKE